MLCLIEQEEIGVMILTPKRYGDDRGIFSELWRDEHALAMGISHRFVQKITRCSPKWACFAACISPTRRQLPKLNWSGVGEGHCLMLRSMSGPAAPHSGNGSALS